MKTTPPTSAYPYPTLSIDVAKLDAFLFACVQAKVGYALGAKVPHHGAVPGRDFHAIDCSGFVDEAIWRATDGAVDLPEGSWYEEQAVKAAGLKHSLPEACAALDGAVRIAFLSAEDGDGTRHVVLVRNGRTLESHGHHGPDSRAWGSCSWMAKTTVYVLTAPGGES